MPWTVKTKGKQSCVFDKNGKLVKTVMVSDKSTKAEITNLPDGEYKTIVYGNDKGVFKKVGPPTTSKVGNKSFLEVVYSFWQYILGAGAVLVAFGIWKIYSDKKKASLVKPV